MATRYLISFWRSCCFGRKPSGGVNPSFLLSPGQAMVELAMGMLALALVLSAMFGFTAYILKSLEMQRELRADAGKAAMTASGDSFASRSGNAVVEVEPLAAEYIFGTEKVVVEESVHIPNMKGL